MDERADSQTVLIGSVVHELRTPLNSLAGWIQVLQSGQADGAVTETALRSMSASTRALARLIDDLADATRTHGQMHLRIEPVDLRAVIETSADIIRPAAADAGLALTLDLTATPCAVSGDADRLQQVFSNVLANAVKFTDAGGIGIVLIRDDACIEVRVTDSGVGIPPHFLPFVFEPFRQADRSPSGRPGFGLGLAICRNIVEAHGGTITVTSPGRDQGTSVIVRLPAR